MLGAFSYAKLSAQTGDKTPPTIVFETPIDGATVQPNMYGMVYVRAKAMDPGGIRYVSLSVPNSGATMWPTNRPKWAIVQAGWSCNDDAPGMYPATCVAVDRAGNRSQQTIWMRLP
jgi:hypothetical protein